MSRRADGMAFNGLRIDLQGASDSPAEMYAQKMQGGAGRQMD